MKRITSHIITLALFAVMLSSCCMSKVTSVTKTTDPKTSEVMVDLDIRTEKITHSYSVTIKKRFVGTSDEDDLKQNAVYEALKKVGADVLVAPQFIVDRNSCPSEITYNITVTGYPAYYTNFRQMPMTEKIELRELKEGASYMVVKKSADNKEIGFDKDIIVTPKGDCNNTIDVEDATVERVVLTNGKEKEKEKKKGKK